MKLGFIARNDLPGIEEDCRFAVDHGFTGLEFNYWGDFRNLTAETVGQMHATLKRFGVECSTFGIWGCNHISPKPEERADHHTLLTRAIGFAKTMEARTFIAGAGEFSADLDQNVATFSTVMRPFIDQVKAAGMGMSIYGFHGGFLKTVDAWSKLLAVVPDIGVKFDPANIMHAGQDHLAMLRANGKRVVHVHIKEHLVHGGTIASQPAAGMGDLHWGKIMAFLYEAGYNGYLTMEPHGPIWGRGDLRWKMILLSQRHIRQFMI